MVKPVRRIVTGHDGEGRSVFLEDGPAPNPFSPSHSPNVGLTNLWLLDAVPATNEAGQADPTARPFRLEPPPAGNVVRIVEFPPDKERNYGNQAEVFSQYGAAQAHDKAARHPGFHKTYSVDYAIVIEGEIWALMDVGETLMQVGDVLIQRGTNHAWANRTDRIARVLFVLNGAAPV
ncbi:cupin domain-containing protein [Reyranella sp. MMS21-HV4-11]|uniref:Cupin domain-containing protein n=1 Tax=Reyranella humidisoli TaxID=2849149 RepID=A0ABS6IJL1_9HYPH|nr:cupin domain-containing protein [Reyranella sp. MMS21-HV4-11]MBU8874771.1 cupin domain-containing protein [Reyranella sp. MMS21-HV4-11]